MGRSEYVRVWSLGFRNLESISSGLAFCLNHQAATQLGVAALRAMGLECSASTVLGFKVSL